MRRALLTVAVLGLIWIGYMAWPVYDLLVLVRAIETRDVERVVRHVYFDAVRISLTNASRSPIKLLMPTCAAPGSR